MPAAAIPSRPPRSVRDFAWRVAGPRDFLINLLINTAVPLWVFRGHDAVPLTGLHSVASVVLPMSFLLCTLTTFFGWFNAIKERRTGTVVPPVAAGTKWAGRAWRAGLAVGLPALATTATAAFVLGRLVPDATVGYWPAVVGIGTAAGLAGLILHARAVERGGAIGVPPPAARWRPTLGDVQETLLIPLYFRARETARPDAIIRDPEAVRIVAAIDYDFARFDAAWVVGLDCSVRSEIFDERVRAFIERHPEAVIINLGAGLDARFHRLDNGRIRWINLDLPDAMALRDRFLPAGERVTHLAMSMFDLAWLEQVAAAPGTPVLLIAEGLFCYCDEADIRRLLATVAARWPGAHVLFQSISPPYVGREADIAAVNLTRAKIRWGIWSGREVAAWDPAWSLVGEWALIDRHRRRWRHLSWLSLLPWVGRNLRAVTKISEIELGPPAVPPEPQP